MIRDTLSQYFDGVAYKRLSAVEADSERSNQHEFNGTDSLKKLLGTDRRKFPARFIYLDDEAEQPVTTEGALTWYESRKPPRSEHRLYYRDNPVSAAAAEGDLIVIGKRPEDTLLVVIAQARSAAENQVSWLFGLPEMARTGLEVKELRGDETRLNAARALILEQIGIEVEETDENFLELLLRRFPGGFPTTQAFSALARETLPDVSSVGDPDTALLMWWDREELLFHTLERHLVADRLRQGFGQGGDDVDAFIKYSMSVHQRRKSRAGRAMENHIEQIMRDNEIRYSRTKITENKSTPDFLFPGIAEYHDPGFSAARLTMLGVKSTTKERWRQVLAEAARIQEKHLFTIEPGITVAQTDEMRAQHLRLVVPQALHGSFKPEQLAWLMKLGDFIGLVHERQQPDA